MGSPSSGCGEAYVHFFKRASDRIEVDMINNVQLNNLLGKQTNGPACIPLRWFTPGKRNQPGLGLTIEHGQLSKGMFKALPNPGVRPAFAIPPFVSLQKDPSRDGLLLKARPF